MKSALLIAVAVCAVCCLKLVDGSVTGFLTTEIGTSAERLMLATTKIKESLMSNTNLMLSPLVIQKGLATFEDLLMNVKAVKQECVKPEMQTAAPDGISRFQSCLMDPATVQARTEEGQKKLENVLATLRTMDAQAAAQTDLVLKAIIVAEANFDVIGSFFLDMGHDIFNGIIPLMKCTQSEATTLRGKLLTYVNEIEQCYA